MGRRKSRIATGTDITERAILMGESVEAKPEVLGKHRYERQFKQVGLPKWRYHMQIVTPFVDYLKVDPDLTGEQRQVAVKEFLRRYREGLTVFCQAIAGEARNFAKTTVITIPARSPKPAMGFSPELIV